MDRIIGHVTYYADQGRDGGAYSPALAGSWIYVAQAMMANRPGQTICVEPVTSIPDWVE
jgi:hypothetical protein